MKYVKSVFAGFGRRIENSEIRDLQARQDAGLPGAITEKKFPVISGTEDGRELIQVRKTLAQAELGRLKGLAHPSQGDELEAALGDLDQELGVVERIEEIRRKLENLLAADRRNGGRSAGFGRAQVEADAQKLLEGLGEAEKIARNKATSVAYRVERKARGDKS